MIENTNDCCTYKNQQKAKYNADNNKLNIKPEHNIVVQYCLGVYVGSMSIYGYKKR